MACQAIDWNISAVAMSDGTQRIESLCYWRFNSMPTGKVHKVQYRTVDLCLTPALILDGIPARQSFPLDFAVSQSSDNNKVSVIQSVLDICKDLTKITSNKFPVIRLIIPARAGYMCKSSLLQERMNGCDLITTFFQFAKAGQELPPFTGFPIIQGEFEQLLNSAVCGMVLRDGTKAVYENTLRDLDIELEKRISLPWNLPMPIPEKVVGIVGCQFVSTIETFCADAMDMGVQVVVLESHGHWIHDPRFSKFGHYSIPVDMTADGSLIHRLVDAVRSFSLKIDGITTCKDSLLVPCAKAAELLSLPTFPAEAIEACVDKYAMRMRKIGNSCKAFIVDTSDDLRQSIDSGTYELKYPLIVKPRKGWGSEGVQKVRNEVELFEAVTVISNYGSKSGALVEEYEDGPEFDANFAIWDGEVIFFELVDDFPCKADDKDSKISDSFLELDMLFPSKLPADESQMIRDTIHQMLLDLGFRSGVFHVEGRVRGSRMEYRSEGGTVDLYPKEKRPEVPACVFLIEINARAPGILSAYSTYQTHGVNFTALQILQAIGDADRFKALSQPFLGGHQQWTHLVIIPVLRGGVIANDYFQDLCDRVPRLVPHISRSACYYKNGDEVPEPTVTRLGCIALFTVMSKESRKHLLELTAELRNSLEILWA